MNKTAETHIKLASGETVKAAESLESVKDKFDNAVSQRVPILSVTDEHGTEHHINANQIVEFHPPIDYGSASFG